MEPTQTAQLLKELKRIGDALDKINKTLESMPDWEQAESIAASLELMSPPETEKH